MHYLHLTPPLFIPPTSAYIQVNLERITLKALQLRQDIKHTKQQISLLTNKLTLQTQVCSEIEHILDLITLEMKAALETDELEMWSSLVHDQAQLIDVEELKQRLHTRQEIEINKLKIEKNECQKLEIQISNLNNNILNYEEYLIIEQGELMRTKTIKPFRSCCIAAANVAGDEVTGAAT